MKRKLQTKKIEAVPGRLNLLTSIMRRRVKFIKRTVRQLAQLGQMEVVYALRLLAKYTHLQIKIRPRIRLFSRITLMLMILFVITGQVARYVKSKESEIKVNGQAILVAQDKETPAPETEIDNVIFPKKSPFEFKKPVDGYITQGFSAYHKAVDIASALGSPIVPLGRGTVEFAGFEADGKGNVVVVDHGDGLKSLYAHMARINVSVGNQVDTSTVIGKIGLTGRTTGPHVHVEIYDNGLMVDPTKVLPE